MIGIFCLKSESIQFDIPNMSLIYVCMSEIFKLNFSEQDDLWNLFVHVTVSQRWISNVSIKASRVQMILRI